MIRAVLFDLDGTLLDRKSSFATFMRSQAERFANALQGISQDDYVEAALQSDQNGTAPRRQAFARMAERLHLSPDLEQELLADYRQGFPGACMLFPGVDRTLLALRSMNIRLGLVTNGSGAMQGRKLDALGLRSRLDVILISEVEGVRKPDPEVFRRATRRLAVTPEDSVFVGDNPEADVRGSKSAGMRAVWVRDSWWEEPIEADDVVDHVEQVVRIVEGWRVARELA